MKLFTYVLTGLMLATVLPTTNVQAAFSDTANSQFKEAIDYIKAEGFVEGYADGTYRPNQLLNINLEAGSSCFIDVAANDWFAPFVCTAKTNGTVGGNPDGTFAPAANINYAEAAKIVIEANNINTNTTSVWYERYINELQARKANLTGVTPESSITRGQMAQLIFALSDDHSGAMMDDDKMMDDGDAMMNDDKFGVMNLSDVSLTDGQQKLLFFNATWCPSCVADVALLQDLETSSNFAFPVVLVDYDSETSLRATYGVTTQHTYVMVDGQGNETQKWINPSDSEVTELVTK